MRVNRRFLYLGVFLVAVGGVLVAADAGVVDTAILTDAVRLWPLAIVALGVAVVVRRTRAGLAAGVAAAVLPGLVLGGGLAAIPRFIGDCGARGEPVSVATEQGTFDGPATVSLRGGCGQLTVTTAPGNGWRLAATNTAGRSPSVSSSATLLEVRTEAAHGWRFLDAGRDDWDVTLPTTNLDELSVAINAGRSQVNLPGAHIRQLEVTANASEVTVDATSAVLSDLAAVVNVGSLSIRLPGESDVEGTLRVGAGEIQICAPPELGLRVTTRGMPRTVDVDGQRLSRTDWTSQNYPTAAHRADLSVHVNIGAVEINPIGGCR